MARILTSASITYLFSIVAGASALFTQSNMTNAATESTYTTLVRKNLASFHVNLSQGNYTLNGALNSPQIHWNYDGTTIIGRAAAVAALGAFAGEGGPLQGITVTDRYLLVDGRVGMVLYSLQGALAAPLPGVPFREGGALYDALGVERFVFDEAALAEDLVTVDQFGRIAAQVAGAAEDLPPPVASPGPLASNPQTRREFREKVRRNLAILHRNVNAGDADANAALAVEGVVVNDNGVDEKTGRGAFVDFIAGKSVGMGAFPLKTFHDFHVIADGKQGAVEYVWQGEQKSAYNGIEVVEGARVRVRGMLFFELDDEGLVTKVTGVHDEAHLGSQLSGKGGYLYP